MVGKRLKNKKTTIVDIARACGVSITTVSRILNERPDVAEETRVRVLEYIKEQGFTPHLAWQQIRSGKSRFIALHFPQDFNPPSHGIITSAAMGCEDAGFSLNLITNTLSESDLLAIFRSGQADGIILMEILTHDWRVQLLRKHEIPFVMVGRCADTTGLSYVDIDVGAGVGKAIHHLYGLGHRQIGFVTLAPVQQEMQYGYTAWALEGYETACRELGLPCLWTAVDLNTKDAVTAVTSMLNENPGITAVVTPQEIGVPGVLKAIQSKGLQIPEDISIIGLFNETFSELTNPPLTTIGFPAQDMGFEAAKILIALLDGSLGTPRKVLLNPELNIRGSTGPVRQLA